MTEEATPVVDDTSGAGAEATGPATQAQFDTMEAALAKIHVRFQKSRSMRKMNAANYTKDVGFLLWVISNMARALKELQDMQREKGVPLIVGPDGHTPASGAPLIVAP
jgi:regulator of PEP synthase PpsR (kinase-PPPase family)